jgi:hypothetical protein
VTGLRCKPLVAGLVAMLTACESSSENVSCTRPKDQEAASHAERAVRNNIAESLGPHSLRSIDKTYERPVIEQCSDRMTVYYRLKPVLEDGSVMVGGDLLYYVSLTSGVVEDVHLGE